MDLYINNKLLKSIYSRTDLVELIFDKDVLDMSEALEFAAGLEGTTIDVKDAEGELYRTFSGYAVSQVQKMESGSRITLLRKLDEKTEQAISGLETNVDILSGKYEQVAGAATEFESCDNDLLQAVGELGVQIEAIQAQLETLKGTE